MRLSPAQAMRLGVDAAMAAPRLVLPLWLAGFAGAVVGVVPLGWLALRALVEARRSGLPLGAASLWLGLAEAAGHASTWVLTGAGWVLAAAGGWLVSTTVRAGATAVLAAQFGRPAGSEPRPLGTALLEAPERWLAASGLGLLLGCAALVSAVGALGAAAAWYVARPGVASSAGLAGALVLLAMPVALDAALGLGAARSAAVDEPPLESLANGLRALAGAPASLLVPWLALAGADVVVMTAAGALGAGLPGWSDDAPVLALGVVARVAVQLAAALGHACVALVRQGTLAALLLAQDGRLPPPASAPRPEPVFEAVALALVVDRDEGPSGA